jgi:hypothetical protein
MSEIAKDRVDRLIDELWDRVESDKALHRSSFREVIERHYSAWVLAPKVDKQRETERQKAVDAIADLLRDMSDKGQNPINWMKTGKELAKAVNEAQDKIMSPPVFVHQESLHQQLSPDHYFGRPARISAGSAEVRKKIAEREAAKRSDDWEAQQEAKALKADACKRLDEIARINAELARACSDSHGGIAFDSTVYCGASEAQALRVGDKVDVNGKMMQVVDIGDHSYRARNLGVDEPAKPDICGND